MPQALGEEHWIDAHIHTESAELQGKRVSVRNPAFQGERYRARAITLAKEARERPEGFMEIGGEKRLLIWVGAVEQSCS